MEEKEKKRREEERGPEPGKDAEKGGLGEPGNQEDEWDQFFPPEDELDWGYNAPVSWHGRPLFDIPRESEDEKIADTPEWRVYSDGQKGLDRTGNRPLRPGASTLNEVRFATPTRTGMGRTRIPTSFEPLRRKHADKKERLHAIAERILADIMSKLELSNNRQIWQITTYIIARFFEERRKAGKPITWRQLYALIGAALEIAVQVTKIPVETNRIRALVLQADLKNKFPDMESLGREIWKLKRELSEKGITRSVMIKYLNSGIVGRQRMKIEHTKNFIRKIVYALDIEDERREQIVRVASRFIEQSVRNGKSLYGKATEAIAAAAVYMFARLLDVGVNQKMIARIANVSETNIRKAFRFLVEDQAIIAVLPLVEPPPVHGGSLGNGNPSL